ncbi:MAG: 50S ribosomal protein L24 [Patescibacteria group bacterium]
MILKKGDNVKIIHGKDRGKKGKVLQVMIKEDKIVIEGLNMRVKNVRAKKSGEKGQRVQFAAPMHVSNVMMVCPKCQKPTRIGFKIYNENKLRICKKCKQELS